jgi:hypothetical protein
VPQRWTPDANPASESLQTLTATEGAIGQEKANKLQFTSRHKLVRHSSDNGNNLVAFDSAIRKVPTEFLQHMHRWSVHPPSSVSSHRRA